MIQLYSWLTLKARIYAAVRLAPPSQALKQIILLTNHTTQPQPNNVGTSALSSTKAMTKAKLVTHHASFTRRQVYKHELQLRLTHFTHCEETSPFPSFNMSDKHQQEARARALSMRILLPWLLRSLIIEAGLLQPSHSVNLAWPWPSSELV